MRRKTVESKVSDFPRPMATTINDETTSCTPDLQPLWHHKAPRVLVGKLPRRRFRPRLENLAGSSAEAEQAGRTAIPQEKELAAALGLAERMGTHSDNAKHPFADGPRRSRHRRRPRRFARHGDSCCKPSRSPMRCQSSRARCRPKSWWQLLERLREIATQAQTKRCRMARRPAGRPPTTTARRRTAARARLSLSRRCARCVLPDRCERKTFRSDTPRP